MAATVDIEIRSDENQTFPLAQVKPLTYPPFPKNTRQGQEVKHTHRLGVQNLTADTSASGGSVPRDGGRVTRADTGMNSEAPHALLSPSLQCGNAPLQDSILTNWSQF